MRISANIRTFPSLWEQDGTGRLYDQMNKLMQAGITRTAGQPSGQDQQTAG